MIVEPSQRCVSFVVCVMFSYCVQVDASVSVDPSVFRYTHARDRGIIGGKTGTKQKSGCKLATAFTKPLTPIQSGTSASDSDGKKSRKGEKNKPKRKVTPPVSPVVDGATGGRGDGESSTDEHSVGDPPPSLRFTKESMAKLKAHLGDGKGECGGVLLIIYC